MTAIERILIDGRPIAIAGETTLTIEAELKRADLAAVVTVASWSFMESIFGSPEPSVFELRLKRGPSLRANGYLLSCKGFDGTKKIRIEAALTGLTDVT